MSKFGWNRRRAWSIGVVCGLVVMGLSSVAYCQSGDVQSQQELILDLKRMLIESHRSQVAPREMDPTLTLPPSQSQASQELIQIRRFLPSVSQEGALLVDSLYSDLQRAPGIRSLLSDVFKLNAALTVLVERSKYVSDHEKIRPDLSALDRDWRNLSFRLSHVRGISKDSRAHIEKINKYKSQLSKALKIEPQLDSRELLRQADTVNVSIRILVDDIKIELEETGRLDPLLVEGRKIQKDARRFADMISGEAGYDDVVKTFRHFKSHWSRYAAKLESFGNRRVERGILRVHHSNHALHKLLWVPESSDWNQLSALTGMLTRDIEKLFEDLSLNQLISLSNSREVVRSASTCSRACKHLDDGVTQKLKPLDLADRFEPVQKSWFTFANHMRQFKGSKVWASMKEMNETVVALREALQVQPGFDREQVAESAATLENLADHLEFDMKTWLDRREFAGTSRRARYLSEASDFVKNTHSFHQAIVNDADVKELQRRSSILWDEWHRLSRYLPMCRTSERDHLMQISRDMTTALVQSQTQLAL